MIDQNLLILLMNEGYSNIKELPERGVVGIRRFIFTVGLCYDLNEYSYFGRYCFPTMADAIDALNKWDGIYDPPGNWIKHKGETGEYSNPAIPITQSNPS